jgi:hypothetical protein
MPNPFSMRHQEGVAAMKVSTSWVEIMTALAIIAVIAFLLTV